MRSIKASEENNFITLLFHDVTFCVLNNIISIGGITDEEADKLAHQLSCIVQGRELARTGEDKKKY